MKWFCMKCLEDFSFVFLFILLNIDFITFHCFWHVHHHRTNEKNNFPRFFELSVEFITFSFNIIVQLNFWRDFCAIVWSTQHTSARFRRCSMNCIEDSSNNNHKKKKKVANRTWQSRSSNELLIIRSYRWWRKWDCIRFCVRIVSLLYTFCLKH